MRLKYLFLLATSLFISACVTHLNQQQCQSMNWYDVGFQEGALGKPIRSLSREQNDCAQFGIAVNVQNYHRGWQEGIRQFCTPNKGFELGTRGQNAIDYCPANLAPEFYRAWQQGLRHYCLPEVGFSLGKAGGAFPDYCPSDLKPLFTAEYQRGYMMYQQTDNLRRRIDDRNREIRDIDYELERIHRQIRGGKDAIRLQHESKNYNHHNFNDSRNIAELEYRKRELLQRRSRLEREISSMEYQLTQLSIANPNPIRETPYIEYESTRVRVMR